MESLTARREMLNRGSMLLGHFVHVEKSCVQVFAASPAWMR